MLGIIGAGCGFQGLGLGLWSRVAVRVRARNLRQERRAVGLCRCGVGVRLGRK